MGLHLQTARKTFFDPCLQSVVITTCSVREIRNVLRPTEFPKVSPTIVLRDVTVRGRSAYAGRKLWVKTNNTGFVGIDVRIVTCKNVRSLVADIGDLGRHSVRQLTLNAEVVSVKRRYANAERTSATINSVRQRKETVTRNCRRSCGGRALSQCEHARRGTRCIQLLAGEYGKILRNRVPEN